MPTSTSPDGIVSPIVGDNIGPLASWFQQQGASVQAALTALRAEFTLPALPAPITVVGADTQAVTATSFADLPNAAALTLVLSRPCWVQITHQARMSTTSGQVIGSSAVTGATTLSETQAEVGGPSTTWGLVMYATGGGTRQQAGSRVVRLNAGTNTIRLRAYTVGAGSGMNYAMLQVAPLRWA